MKPRVALSVLVLTALLALPAAGSGVDANNPGVLEPVTSALQGKDIRIPNTDQSVDGIAQSVINGPVARFEAGLATSLLGHPIDQVSSPNQDMRDALAAIAAAAKAENDAAMKAAADELMAILLGTTEGRMYDGFSMLNFNRFKDPRIGSGHFPPDAVPEEYKMKRARDTGETFISPYDGAERKIWEANVSLLYYDGQIDSDTFLLLFPVDAHPDDTVRVHYRIYGLAREDFSPTIVMLDRREAQNTVQFPFKGYDAVWVAFERGEVLDLTLDFPPIRQLRGVYTWGWRDHPPRIQFLQPVYEIVNQHTGETELDPQSKSYVYRNREELTLDAIGEAAPEMKMYRVAQAIAGGASPQQIDTWLNDEGQGPRGTWFEWADLALNQRQLPPEAWEMLESEEGLAPGSYGDYDMLSVFLNNEMYGEGPYENEIFGWQQGDTFKVKLINLDRHTHYFRNVDFGTRLNDDIGRCCGGGQTSFEVMNFKPSYGAPKVAEMQWRAGWGFRPHYDVIQQQEVFARPSDRLGLAPYRSGFDDVYYGYLYSEKARRGDFRFSPPPFIITDHDHPAPFPLRDADGETGLIIGQFTEGYGTGQMCPNDPYPGFCETDFGPFNPNAVLNWPSPNDPSVPKTELRFPPFLRNPAQGEATAGDIIPPTGAWRPFLWINPYNGSLYIDPDQPELGYWADLTYSHGAPVFAENTLTATIELPRASGQVFYQFDDLFHDNSIFSPHPLFEGEATRDRVRNLRAFQQGGDLVVRGRISMHDEGRHAGWVTLHDGIPVGFGCAGEPIATAPVRELNGRFVFRLPSDTMSAGEPLCVQSLGGGYRGTTVQ